LLCDSTLSVFLDSNASFSLTVSEAPATISPPA